jgi:hypothetical protein
MIRGTNTQVGYGDIAATNRTEYLVCLLGMAVGATVFGYVIGNVSALADLVDPESTKYSEKMERVRQEIYI